MDVAEIQVDGYYRRADDGERWNRVRVTDRRNGVTGPTVAFEIHGTDHHSGMPEATFADVYRPE